MDFILWGFVAAVVVFISIMFFDGDDEAAIGGFMSIVFIMVIIYLLSSIFFMNSDIEYIKTGTEPVYRLDNGEFFKETLDGGIIYKTEKNTKVGYMVLREDIEIKFTKDEPRLETYESQYVSEFTRRNKINYYADKKILYVKE